MKKIFLILSLILSLNFISNGQTITDEQVPKYKAIFITSFIRFVGWTEQAKSSTDFNIAVLNNSEIYTYLKASADGKTFGYQTIRVHHYKNVSDIPYSQIIFVGDEYFVSNIALIHKKFNPKFNNILILSDKETGIKFGSMINFIIRDQKLKFEISQKNLAEYNLKVNNRLKTLKSAIVID